MSIQSNRMTDWALRNNPSVGSMSLDEARQSVVDAKLRKSSTGKNRARSSISVNYDDGILSTARGVQSTAGSDRPSVLGASIKPHTPARLVA